MALEENKHDHLVELGGSDYEIVDGEPNIKGWDVKNELGEPIGKVDELLFDQQSRQVRYLIVELDQKLGLDDYKKVLVPIGIAELYKDGHAQDEEDSINEEYATSDDATVDVKSGYQTDEIYDPTKDGKVVIVPVSMAQMALLPSYQKGNVTPETESSVRDIFSGLGAAGLAEGVSSYNRDDFYIHEHFNESNFYNGNKFPLNEGNPVGDNEISNREEIYIIKDVEDTDNTIGNTPQNRGVDADPIDPENQKHS
jgi:hypothetical protein